MRTCNRPCSLHTGLGRRDLLAELRASRPPTPRSHQPRVCPCGRSPAETCLTLSPSTPLCPGRSRPATAGRSRPGLRATDAQRPNGHCLRRPLRAGGDDRSHLAQRRFESRLGQPLEHAVGSRAGRRAFLRWSHRRRSRSPDGGKETRAHTDRLSRGHRRLALTAPVSQRSARLEAGLRRRRRERGGPLSAWVFKRTGRVDHSARGDLRDQ